MDGGTATMNHASESPDPSDAAPLDEADCVRNESAHESTDDVAPEIQPRQVVEAILFATDSPLPAAKIAKILGVGDAREVRGHIAALNQLYADMGLSFRINEIAGGFQMLTLPAFNAWLSKLLRTRDETRLTPAALETLAIVAYKQPVTRADVESIRGVAAGDVLNRLREMNLVKIVGRAEDLGRPMLYGTTKRFLEVFGLASLEELPQVEALRGGAAAAPPPREPVGSPARSGEGVASESAESTEAVLDDTGPTLKVVNDDETAA
ncbi:MAG: hypothetical protein HBSAPP02_14880 [Phycisphaerae bacterium]|nr:MAG: SMC-Scp complex subunit ScpB [Planctomycetia bacterium]RIK71337.1 MAG: SMC-Scp complex subunit ScpB [Planctomycetota bacterium]GJQ26456.1 MAG: hypothetical protein HBSAPP02_14880 [Phycisphaerae bacterium]